MLLTKFRENRPAGSGEEDFWRVFTIYGHGGHLGHVTWTIYISLGSPFPRRLHIKFGFDRPSRFREEDVWALWTTTTTDGRMTDHWYTISSPCEPNGSGELTKPEDQWYCKRSPDIWAYCKYNQRTIGPVNAHLIFWPSKAQSIQNLENIW